MSIISDEFAAAIAEGLDCDCDHSGQIAAEPHREWCTKMTPLGVIKHIAETAIRLALAGFGATS